MKNSIYITNDKGYIFTGFYDKNGKMIYHFDTLIYDDGVLKIKSKVTLFNGCFMADGSLLWDLTLDKFWSVVNC